MNKILFGALAGIVATIPMTLLMIEWHQRLPPAEKYPLPPREIVDELAEKAGVDEHLSETEKTNLSIIGHFAYGALNGAVYAPLVSLVQTPNPVNGVVYGLGIWTASYLGWLPALHILRSADEHPAQRNALMITAHIVWGGTLGFAAGQMMKADRKKN
jgi:uncharacterized membrane protein YagU involved in acid resistance